MQTESPRVNEISNLVSMLNDADQEALLKALKSQVLLAQARHLDQSVKSNKIGMDEIVKIVRQVRQIRTDGHASA